MSASSRKTIRKPAAPKSRAGQLTPLWVVAAFISLEDATDVTWEGIERDDFRPGATPTLRDGGVFLAPRPQFKRV
jgi:hypothetical protein